jgi:hypothetical protein
MTGDDRRRPDAGGARYAQDINGIKDSFEVLVKPAIGDGRRIVAFFLGHGVSPGSDFRRTAAVAPESAESDMRI